MKRMLALLMVLIVLPVAVQAAPVEAGAAAIFVTGAHTEPQGADTSQATARAIPAPFLTVDVPMGRWRLHAEAIPPMGTVPVAANSLGLDGVQLTYVNGYLGYDLAPHTRVFAGETIYNQQTHYGVQYAALNVRGAYVVSYSQYDRSRPAGAQYGIAQKLRETPRSSLEIIAAVNPRMTAQLGESTRYAWSDGTTTGGRWFVSSETGSQIDVNLVARHRYARRTTIAYGVRYLNLTMKFADGSLADRNAFFVPFVGLSTTLGR